MQDTKVDNPQDPGFFFLLLQALNSCLRHFRLISLVVLIPTTATIISLLFFVDIKYEGRSVFQPPKTEKQNSFAKLLGSDGMALQALMGQNSDEADVVWTILNSRELHKEVIDHFHLADHYKFKGKFEANLLKDFRSNMTLSENDEDMFELVIEDTDPVLARDINAFMIQKTDSIYQALNRRKVNQTRLFFQARLDSVQRILDSLTQDLADFQQTNRFYEPAVQLESGLTFLGQLEAERILISLDMQVESKKHGTNTKKYQELHERHQAISQQIVKRNKGMMGISLPSGLNQFAELNRDFGNRQRELTVQAGIYKFLRQNVEELYLEEGRNFKNINVLEHAWVNDKKVSPPRSALTILVILVSLAMGVFLSVMIDFLQAQVKAQTPLGNEWLRLRHLRL